jgi:hypothetical protein
MRPTYILAGSLIIGGSSLLVLALVNANSSLGADGGSARVEIAAGTSKKIEDRAPVGEQTDKRSRTRLAGPTVRTELAIWAVSSKGGQGARNLWNYDGSILRLEAVGRARRF